jgi:hypothetical protein
VIRVFMVYESEPDAERYGRHVQIARKVPGATFRHGRVFGSPFGQPDFAYYAEFEFADRESFERGAASPDFKESGKDAMEIGIPFKVHFAEVD